MQKLSPLSLYPHTFTPIEKQIVLLKSHHQCNGEGVWAALDTTKHIWVKVPDASLWISCCDFGIVCFHRTESETSTVLAGTPKEPLLPAEKGLGVQIPAPHSSGKLGTSEAPSWCSCPGRSHHGLEATAKSPGTRQGGNSITEDVTNSTTGMQINPLFSSW